MRKEELDNELLGTKGLSAQEMEELMRMRARGELVDLLKEYESV